MVLFKQSENQMADQNPHSGSSQPPKNDALKKA